MNQRQPNILIIQADQASAQWLPCYGHPVVKMPHLSALAQQGVVFDNAYCTSPLCVPSRPSMMTGRLPSRIGAYDTGSEFPASQPCFTHYLRTLDYRTILAGKMHFIGPDQLHGFEERLTTEIYVTDFGWSANWSLDDQRYEASYNMSSVLSAGTCAASIQLDYDEEVAYQAVRKLYALARDPDPRPFCFCISFTHPHDPYIIPQAYWDRYGDDEIDLPTVPPLPFDQLDAHAQRMWLGCAMNEATITAQHTRNARRGYYGALSYIDDKIGQLLHALKATDQYEKTIIIFTSDHGDMLGERGMWYKMLMYEPSIRVPLVVHAPAWFTPRRVAPNVSLVDLLPTLVDLAQLPSPPPPTLPQTGGGTDVPPTGTPLPPQPGEGRGGVTFADPIDGQSLLPLLYGDTRGARDCVFAEYLADGITTPHLMIKLGPYKYMYGEGDPELLYDLAVDPHELTNVATNPAYADVLARLRDRRQQQWDPPALRRQIIADQQRRQLIHRALSTGKRTHWDFQPYEAASEQYFRSHKPAWEFLWRSRYPPVGQ